MEYIDQLKTEEEVWKCVLEELMERRLLAEEELEGRKKIKESEVRGCMMKEPAMNESFGRAYNSTSHVVVVTAPPVQMYIISSLMSRTDTQLVSICPITGSLSYTGAHGVDVFPCEEAALEYLTKTLNLNIAQQTRGVAIAGIANGHLALITSSQLTATLPCGASIFTVTSARWFSPILHLNRKKGSQKEEELLSSFPLAHAHFYSEDTNLTSSYPAGSVPCPEFHWNEELSKEFKHIGLEGWCVSLLQGYAVSKQLPADDGKREYVCLIAKKSRQHPGSRYIARGLNSESAPANEVECQMLMWREVDGMVERQKAPKRTAADEKRDRELFDMLVSGDDSSSCRSESSSASSCASECNGPSLGSSHSESSRRKGAPAHALWASYLWRRGTIPLHWSSELNGKAHIGKAAIVLQSDPHKGTATYFASLVNHLKQWKGYTGKQGVTCISLLHTDPDHSEIELGDAYSEAVKMEETQKLGIEMCLFDWHKVNKTLGLDKAPDVAWECLENTLRRHGFAAGKIRNGETSNEVEFMEEQQGVVRVNCADSLDRTNGCTYLVALQMATEMRLWLKGGKRGEFECLKGIAGARSRVGEGCVDVLCNLFIQCGDVLSQLYTGTVAAYSDSIRQFTSRTSKAQHSNTMLSVLRRYQNVVYDPWRADSFTAFLRSRDGSKKLHCLTDRPSDVIRASPPLPVDLLHDTERQLYSLPPDVALLTVVVALHPNSQPTDIAICIRSLNGKVPGAMDVYVGRHTDSLEPVIVNASVPICNDGTWLVYELPKGNPYPVGSRLVQISLRDMEGTGMVVGQLRVLGTSSRIGTLPDPLHENTNMAKHPSAFVSQITPYTENSNCMLEGGGGGPGWDIPQGVKGRMLVVLADLCSVSHIEVECDAKCEFSVSSGTTEDNLVPFDLGKGSIAPFDLIGIGGEVMRVLCLKFKGLSNEALTVKKVNVIGKKACVCPVPSRGTIPCGTPSSYSSCKASVTRADRHVEVKLSEKTIVSAVRVKPDLSGGDPTTQAREVRVTLLLNTTALRADVITIPKCLKGTPLDFPIPPMKCSMVHFDVLATYGGPCGNIGKCQALKSK
eukprot:TRINITY_DN20883_c0_g1_i1.p1 TRINITY_DN20883_c0_g1~~TRINITY_DN20883_c0_g1_i1.p1  ORF type:complete len:1078 (+),score=227.45 TRINITY_DN20883_c0_g1_i1:99-3332(+)